MAAENRVSRLHQAEINSLNGRLKKFNQENDDLLQRLSELKFENERKEKEFEQEKTTLRERIRYLERENLEIIRQLDLKEISAKNSQGQELRDKKFYRGQVEEMRQEHGLRERELLDRMVSIKKEYELKEGRMRNEIEQLKKTIQSKLKTIEDMRKDNNRLLEKTHSVDEEIRLRDEINRLRKDLETESKMLTEARRENGELRKILTEKMEESHLQIQRREEAHHDCLPKELGHAMQRQIDRLSAIVDDKENLLESALNEQARLRRTIELTNDGHHHIDHTDRGTRSDREVERLTAMLSSKEDLFQEALKEKRKLQTRIDELLSARGLVSERDRQLQSEVERLNATLRTKEILLEEMLAKNKELSTSNDQLREDLKEARVFLKSISDTNQGLVEKNLQLGKALAKTKAETEQEPEKISPYLTNLLKVQESHIEDLQKQIGGLRATILNYPNDFKSSQPKHHLPLFEAITEVNQKPNEDSELDENILKQLKQAKINLDSSRKRISQLENWLDEIYKGPGTDIGGRFRSSDNPASKTAKRTVKSVPSLPEIAKYRLNSDDRTMTMVNKKLATKKKTHPVWNSTTSFL